MSWLGLARARARARALTRARARARARRAATEALQPVAELHAEIESLRRLPM